MSSRLRVNTSSSPSLSSSSSSSPSSAASSASPVTTPSDSDVAGSGAAGASILHEIFAHHPEFHPDEASLEGGDFFEVSETEYWNAQKLSRVQGQLLRQSRRRCHRLCDLLYYYCGCGEHHEHDNPDDTASGEGPNTKRPSVRAENVGWNICLSPKGDLVVILGETEAIVRSLSTAFSGQELRFPIPPDSLASLRGWLRGSPMLESLHLDLDEALYRRPAAWSLGSELLAIGSTCGDVNVFDVRKNGAQRWSWTTPRQRRVVALQFCEQKCDATDADTCPDLLILCDNGDCYRFHVPLATSDRVHAAILRGSDIILEEQRTPPSSLRLRRRRLAAARVEDGQDDHKTAVDDDREVGVGDRDDYLHRRHDPDEDDSRKSKSFFSFRSGAHSNNIYSAMVLDTQHDPPLLVVASVTPFFQEHCVSMWRVLPASFELVRASFEPPSARSPRSSVFMKGVNKFLSYMSSPARRSRRLQKKDDNNNTNNKASSRSSAQVSTKLALSPDCSKLLMLDASGTLTVWSTAGLEKLRAFTPAEDLVVGKLDDTFALINEQNNLISDVSWWNDRVVVRTYLSGHLVLTPLDSSLNLLGESPEWFHGVPRVTQLLEQYHPALVPVSSKSYASLRSEDAEQKLAQARIRAQRFFVLECERRYRRRRKLWSLVDEEVDERIHLHRVFRLLSFSRSTPQEFFDRKVEDRQYEDALALAETYGLDPDPVYQMQWRRAEVSVDTLPLLDAIQDRAWVLRQCAKRVCASKRSMEVLLHYAIQRTAGRSELFKRYEHRLKLFCAIHHVYNLKEFKGDRWAPSPSSSPSSSSSSSKPCALDVEDYMSFRDGDMVEAGCVFAQRSNFHALRLLWHDHELAPDEARLTVLGQIPETVSPELYKELGQHIGDGAPE